MDPTIFEAPPEIPRSSATRAVALATVATMVAYLFTLLQQVLFARSLGVNTRTDALAVALAWVVGTSGPLGVTLASVLLPKYVQAWIGHDRSRARSLLQSASAIGLGLAAVLALATLLGAGPLATALAPGLEGADHDRLAGLLRLTAPLQILWTMVWLLTARANARARYVVTAASFALPTIPVIAVLGFVPNVTVEQVVVAYVVGAAFQVLAVAALNRGSLTELLPRLGNAPTREIVRALLPVGAAFLLMSSTGLAIRGLASLHGAGAIATSDYANRLEIAGEQVLLSGFLAVIFTRWSGRHDLRETPAETSDSIVTALLTMAGPAVAVGFAVPILGPAVVALLFEGGRFEAENTEAVAGFLGWMGPGIAARIVILLAVRALLAGAHYKALPMVGLVALVATLGTGLALGSMVGLVGVALGFSAGWIGAMVAALAALRVRPRVFVPELGRAVLMSAAAAAVAGLVVRELPDVHVIRLVVGSAAFGATAWVAGHVLAVAAVRQFESRLPSWARP